MVKTTVNSTEIKDLLQILKDAVLPKYDEVIQIIQQAQDLLQHEPNVIYTNGPTSIVGDLHGQYYDFLYMLEISNQEHAMVFLGDYVDRGHNSVELILHVLLLKLIRKDKVVILRGNHENRAQTSAYGFMEECVSKYDIYVYWKLCDLFTFMPLAAVVNSHYMCIHGGIVPDLTLEKLQHLDRVSEYPELGSILWSDPSDDIDGFGNSQRGAGYLFGAVALREFLRKVKCTTLVRSHQLVMDGVKEHFCGMCITVWSAPNYCYKCKNIASIMEINAVNDYKLIFYEAVDEQYKL